MTQLAQAKPPTTVRTTAIVVAGDITPQFDLYLGNQPKFNVGLAGAALIHKLLAEVSRRASNDRHGLSATLLADLRTSPPALAVASVWEPRPIGKLSRSEKTCVWRPAQSIALANPAQLLSLAPKNEPLASKPPSDAHLMVIQDDAGVFRNGHPACTWPDVFEHSLNQLEWIVIQSAAPLCQGAAWWQLTQTLEQCKKLIVIIPIEQLRRADVQISKGASWERTALDLANELMETPSLADLGRVAHVIISIQSEGALWMCCQPGDKARFRLIFDPEHMEGEWAADVGLSGDASGLTSCFTAAVAAGLAICGDERAMEDAIKRGLRTMRLARILGHGRADSTSPGVPIEELAGQAAPPIPGAKAGDGFDLRSDALGSFGSTILPDGRRESLPHWQILLRADPARPQQEPLWGIARRVAIFGPKAMHDAPIARFGKLTTADRGEIESLGNLKRLIHEYQERKDESKPLSIAVFGPPGAGKSFGIKQIAGQVLGARTPFLEFNLSQFSDEKDLIGAFHQVRDKALEGIVPVVFWDEFDSRGYGWLQFLLAPMQDGKFQEGQITHRIGRSIFVFAGATSSQFKDFGPSRNDAKGQADFRLKKGPDFLSRVHGSLDVLGPNQRRITDEQGKPIEDITDVCFPVRRALLLRSLLGMSGEKENQRLDIDYGLLCALLEVQRYIHGSRSMEKITAALRETQAAAVRRSNLPSDEVLRMNVDVESFRAAMTRARHFQTFAPRLAPPIHDDWRRTKRQNMKDKPFPNDVDFADLSPELKTQNVAAAMRMPRILELAGLYLIPLDPSKPIADEGDAWRSVEPLIEMLAEEEHNLWMDVMLTNGWKPAPHKPATCAEEEKFRRDRLHHCLVAFEKLDADTQEYDRNLIRGYPRYAEAAGFRIVAALPT